MARTIVVAGALAQRPFRGGHAWVFLQYLLGFRRLGWDVLFVDWLTAGMCVDGDGNGPCPVRDSANLRYTHRVLDRFGLGDDFTLLDKDTGAAHGLSWREATERTRRSALLINVMGYLDDEPLLRAAPARAFLDIDPGFGQMWSELGLADPFAGHDAYVTVGEKIGDPDCTIPTCGLEWIATPQPVVLEHWPQSPAGEGAFTSVGAWRGPYGPVEYEGATYGLRVHEFRRLATLPRLTGAPFEIALEISEAEGADLTLLRDQGWTLADPRVVAPDPERYRDYIRGSLAELAVAKNMYVASRGGWFSDRSICYLASGRPVIALDTGFVDRYPHGEGLLAFSTLEQAHAAVNEVRSDPARHGRAARAIAEAHFDSDEVLSRLLARLGVG